LNKLTTDDVCLILRECATSKVSKIQFGELIVEFGLSKEETHQSLPALTQQQHDKLNEAQVQADAEVLREIEKEELMLTDPEKYEEMLQKGEL
jgi:ribonuclease HIII